MRPQALEKALLAFHTTKMAEINMIVKELWQKTYRNQDIDYIQACSIPYHAISKFLKQSSHSLYPQVQVVTKEGSSSL